MKIALFFSHNPVYARQTDRQTNTRRRLRYLLGDGNNF